MHLVKLLLEKTKKRTQDLELLLQKLSLKEKSARIASMPFVHNLTVKLAT
jgi:hypothetical protein